jgi:hypothetical protein
VDPFNLKLQVVNSNLAIPLHLEIHLDNQVLVSQAISEPVLIDCSAVDLAEGAHQLKFVMTGKIPAHTVLDADGNIVSDAVLQFSAVEFDDVNVDTLLQKLGQYTHDFNGSGNSVTETFYHVMGCTGYLSLEFTSPAHLWILEHM